MKTIKGNLITLAQQGKFDVIAHGCNCFCNMNSGIAPQIKAAWPGVYDADLKTIKGDGKKLGTYTYYTTPQGLIIINAYTQYRYGGNKRKLDYNALRSCMKQIKTNYTGKKIGLPKIGAGLAGGDWETISNIISEELCDEDVTIVEFEPAIGGIVTNPKGHYEVNIH